jgi:hypothetical protein
MCAAEAKPMLPPGTPCLAADFNALVSARPHRVLLETYDTRCDLERQSIELADGLRALFHQPDGNERGEPDPILCLGTVRFEPETGWVAYLDGDRLMRRSDWA